jgi:Uncharacterized conserved protein
MNPISSPPGDESLIKYPSDFPIENHGRECGRPGRCDCAVVLQHAPDFDPATMELRPSSGRNYLSCTCTIRATSRAQLDDLTARSPVIRW